MEQAAFALCWLGDIARTHSTQQMILLRQKKCHYFLFYLYFNGFDIRAVLSAGAQ
jgi:hypothetical protein